MEDELFRKKSLEKAKSPDSLSEYIRVSNPSIWLLLISVIVLLLGASIWGIYGNIDSTIPSFVNVKDGDAVCYVSSENIDFVHEGMTVTFDYREAVISKIGEKESQGYRCVLQSDSYLEDGLYEGKVVLKRFKPLSFIFN